MIRGSRSSFYKGIIWSQDQIRQRLHLDRMIWLNEYPRRVGHMLVLSNLEYLQDDIFLHNFQRSSCHVGCAKQRTGNWPMVRATVTGHTAGAESKLHWLEGFLEAETEDWVQVGVKSNLTPVSRHQSLFSCFLLRGKLSIGSLYLFPSCPLWPTLRLGWLQSLQWMV